MLWSQRIPPETREEIYKNVTGFLQVVDLFYLLLICTFFSSVQSLSHIRLMDCNTSGFPVHHQLPESTQTHVHRVRMPSNYLILCRPLLLLPLIFPSIRVFSKESVLRLRWPKCWSFSISPTFLGMVVNPRKKQPLFL